jgi:outer membrane beta-barrel protein
MRQQQRSALAWGLLAAAAGVHAQTAPATPANSQPAAEQVIQPQVQRREVKRPEYPSNDFAIGLYGGVYATQNFGSAGVGGVRLSYHITEDFFVDGTYGQTKVSDDVFRQVLPGGIFANRTETLTYYGISAGWNVFPGEVFFGRNTARPSQGYIVAGVGSTDFAGQKRQTYHVGFGYRLIVTNWLSVQADARNHIFTLDLLGTRKSTNNPEVTLGVTLFF